MSHYLNIIEPLKKTKSLRRATRSVRITKTILIMNGTLGATTKIIFYTEKFVLINILFTFDA